MHPEPRRRLLDRTIDVLGIHVHDVARDELLAILDDWSARGTERPRRLCYANAHVFNLAVEDPHFAASLNDADILIFEGFGGCLGAQMLGHVRPEQLATMDWMDDFLSLLAERRGSVYLLGDEPHVAERCAAMMAGQHPGLRIAGTHHGYFDRQGPDNTRVVETIDAAQPDVLMVGMGSPVQERWIDENLEQLDVRVVMALGAMFRWYAQEEPRAPAWMRRFHLEWLLRLIRHPVRHFQRYVVGNPKFLMRVVRQRLRNEPPQQIKG